MSKEIERQAFSARLREALRNAGMRDDSPTTFMRNISLHGIGVSMCGARKWLMGEAVPTQDKLTKIAVWLGVDPAWLRFGVGPGSVASPAPPKKLIAPRTLRAMESFGYLAERDQMIVQSIIDSMLRVGGGRS